jgi:hypothetical protein
MKIDFTDRVLDALEEAPASVQKAFRKTASISGRQSPAPVASRQEIR